MAGKFYPERVLPRFWAKVDKSGECWIWTAGKMASGYGTFSPGPNLRALAHRFSYEIENGPLGEGEVVMHLCDNPSCVRPEHLQKGSQAENLADMRAKLRSVDPPLVVGTRHHSNKLSEADVRRIRSLKGQMSGCRLAKEYGVSGSSIYDIWRGRKWKHLPESED